MNESHRGQPDRKAAADQHGVARNMLFDALAERVEQGHILANEHVENARIAG
jgi:hypothetical protein